MWTRCLCMSSSSGLEGFRVRESVSPSQRVQLFQICPADANDETQFVSRYVPLEGSSEEELERNQELYRSLAPPSTMGESLSDFRKCSLALKSEVRTRRQDLGCSPGSQRWWISTTAKCMS